MWTIKKGVSINNLLDKQVRWQGERLRVSLYHRVEWKREEGKGVVKHVLLAKFKDSTPPDQIEELIKSYTNLVSLIPPMKAFHWYLSSI